MACCSAEELGEESTARVSEAAVDSLSAVSSWGWTAAADAGALFARGSDWTGLAGTPWQDLWTVASPKVTSRSIVTDP